MNELQAEMAEGCEPLSDEEVRQLLVRTGERIIFDDAGRQASEEGMDAVDRFGRRVLATALKMGEPVTTASPDSAWLPAWDVWELYGQTEIWRNVNGEAIRLDDMDTRYLRTVRLFIERSGSRHCFGAVIRLPLHHSNGDMAQLSLEQEWDRAMTELMEWAASRMSKAPLYRAICAALRDRRRHVRTYHVRHPADNDVPVMAGKAPF